MCLRLLVALSVFLWSAIPSGGHEGHQHQTVKRSLVGFNPPSVVLVRDDGVPVDFAQIVPSTRPVYVNFIFTSCTSVCPVMSQVFAQLQEALGPDSEKVEMVSVSIDPEHDTPRNLSDYARQFGAGPQWRFYSGTADATLAVQKAFRVYSRDKMNHPVTTFYRAVASRRWVRIDGFATPAQLEAEFRSTSAK